MKKKMLSILIVAIMIGNLTACGKAETISKPKEYDIEEFGKLLDETDKLFEKESEYLTTDEMQGKEAYELYEECSKETGLPFNKKVTIRGKKEASIIGFNLVSSDGSYYVPCYFGSGSYKDKTEENVSMFIDEGENIVVTGMISEKEDSYGCITNAVFESPKDIGKIYENNINEVLSDCNETTECKVIFGEVELIQSLDEFENGIELMKDTITDYQKNDYYFDSVATISSTPGSEDGGSISFMYDAEVFDLKEGDKIATQGFVDDLMHSQNINGDIDVFWGFIGNAYDIYKFN